MTNTITIAIIDNIDTIITHIIIIICLSVWILVQKKTIIHLTMHNQMTIFKWLHLAFSFWELMQKKHISSTARTIHPSVPHPQ